MSLFKIEKRDGREENFNHDKVIDSLLRAGVSTEQAEFIASEIESWAPTVAIDSKVRSADIRTKLLSLLQAINLQAAARYESYRKKAV
ncbi:MAG: hypothetical protein JW991_00240 [Candidatus Pacebacteria bacterium]|nr:hypothetical protein [Candidatus Paceibacterota bacterium]